MKSKKGFTIVELFAVVIILLLLTLIAIAVTTKIVEKSRMEGFIKEANTFAKAALNKHYADKLNDVNIRDDLFNGTKPGKVCYSIPDNLIGSYVEKEKNKNYRGSIELCYADDCEYQYKIWFNSGDKYYLNGLTEFDNVDVIEKTTDEEFFDSCGYDTIGSFFGSNDTAEFDYSGTEKRMTILKTGTYRIEAWGAQGGSQTPRNGGLGAYAYGEIELKKGDIIYINVGGQGTSECGGYCPGGYNGGGSAENTYSSGGGATTIAFASGVLGKVNSFKNYIIVAGGGGGVASSSESSYKQGQGVCMSSCGNYVDGGARNGSASGGGYRSPNANLKGYGGTSFVGNMKVKNGIIYCFKCSQSTDTATKTLSTNNSSRNPIPNYAKYGNGYARITYFADYQISYNLNGGTLSTTNPHVYSKDSSTITLNNPTKAGYDFAGWSDGSSNLFDKSATPYLSGSYINAAGEEISHEEFSIYQVNVDPNTNYILLNSGVSTAPGYAIYDSSGNYITGDGYRDRATVGIKTPSNAAYIRVSVVTKTTSNRYDRKTYKIIKPNLTQTVPTGSTGNKKFTAYYVPTVYTIAYSLNGGTASNVTKYNIESDTFSLTKPIKDGYVFLGWTGANGTNPQLSVSINKGSTGDKTYTANYDKLYEIAYDYNIPEYTFPSGVFMNSGYIPDYDHDFKLELTVNLPTPGVRYLLIGNYEQSRNLNIEITTGNRFRMWQGSQIALPSGEVPFEEDISVVCNYTASTKSFVCDYTSNSTSNSGTGTVSAEGFSGNTLRLVHDYRGTTTFTPFTLKSLKITAVSRTVSIPTTVTRPDLTFDGWYTSKIGGTQVTGETVPSGNSVTYYAHWSTPPTD